MRDIENHLSFLKITIEDSLHQLGEFSSSDKEKAHWLEWKRRRGDGLFELFSVQVGRSTQEQFSLAIQYVLHFFKECPNPAGVFGCSQFIQDLLSRPTLAELVARGFVWGANWFSFDLDPDSTKSFGTFCSIVGPEVRLRLDRLAEELASDDFRCSAYRYVQDSGTQIKDKEEILEKFNALGSPAPIVDGRLRYSASKAANQVFSYLCKEKHWARI